MPINKEVGGIDIVARRMANDRPSDLRELETAFGCDDGAGSRACNREVSMVVLFDIKKGDPENLSGARDIPIMLCTSHYPTFQERFTWLVEDASVNNVRVLTREQYLEAGRKGLLERVLRRLIGK